MRELVAVVAVAAACQHREPPPPPQTCHELMERPLMRAITTTTSGGGRVIEDPISRWATRCFRFRHRRPAPSRSRCLGGDCERRRRRRSDHLGARSRTSRRACAGSRAARAVGSTRSRASRMALTAWAAPALRSRRPTAASPRIAPKTARARRSGLEVSPAITYSAEPPDHRAVRALAIDRDVRAMPLPSSGRSYVEVSSKPTATCRTSRSASS